MTGPDSTPGAAEASSRVQASITRKRSGKTLAGVNIRSVIADYLAGRIPDYQMAAWLATVAAVGLDLDETFALTRAYVDSGVRLDLSGVDRPVVDKHSTGGVGDKLSLIVAPLAAACGARVVKMSGRGLGYAGGTIDKLESIPGLRLDLSAADMVAVLKRTGMVITGQSAELAPGDGATYALRDVTGTVESIPLIAASIIGKKVAVGADAVVLDVKTGAGALIPDPDEARLLARTMVELAKRFDLRCDAVLSDMSQPLGYAVGNSLEVKEALAVLQGAQIPGVTESSIEMASLMLRGAEPGLSESEAVARTTAALADGRAYELFVSWAEAQGGDVRVLERPELLPTATVRDPVRADRDGWVCRVNPRAIGVAALRVGAGRLGRAETLAYAAGVVLRQRVGDHVRAGEVLAEVHHDGRDADAALASARSAFVLSEQVPAPRPMIHEILSWSDATGPERGNP